MNLARITTLFIFCCFLWSCKKNTGLPGYIKDLEIMSSDTIYVGANIHFFSTASPSSTFLWNFGTGETSTVDSPYYMFKVPRAYKVTLKVNDTGNGVSKMMYISIGQDILGKICGSRTWSLHYTAHSTSGNIDTTYEYQGTLFAINNDTSLLKGSTVLPYIYPGTALPAGRSLTFGTGDIESTVLFWARAYYDYSKDSLNYTVFTPISSGFEKYDYASGH